jgi:sugar transferase (PEP-CTERM/EpsH1 system associated)
MRVLLLTHRLPFPPNKGDKIRSFNLLSYLARRHEVYVVSLIDDTGDLVHVPQVKARARCLVYRVIGRKLRTICSLRALLQGRPVSVTYFYSAPLQRRIDSLIDVVSFDCYFCFSSPMAEYLYRSRHKLAEGGGALRIMDFIDVDSYKWRQYAAQAPFWKAWVYRLEAAYLSAYEQRIARTFDRLFIVSEQERRLFPDSAGTCRLLVLPNGVDLEFFSPRHVPLKRIAGPYLVFTGMMDYWPNIEGIKWFVERIFPRIRQFVPDAQLYVVGNRPTAEVRKLARFDGVTVTGFVEDVRDYVAGASVCIVPLRIARGIQNKMLEAMAMGKPVVTTTQAFTGVHAVAGEDIVVADGDEDFVQAVVGLLRNIARAERIGSSARMCVERHYSWDSNLGKLSEIGL